MNARGRTGARGEDIALRLLEEQGMRMLCRNLRTPYGEIDLVMDDAGTLVFVEVKTRMSKAHGSALESVSPAQQKRIARAALHHHAHSAPDRPMRIDVVGLDFDGEGFRPVHIRSAITG